MGFTPGYAAPSPTNVRVPTSDLAKVMTAFFTRDPMSFALNRWTQIIPAPAKVGYYRRFDPAAPARSITTNDGLWPPGQPAPTGAGNKQIFTDVLYKTRRRERTWNEDKETIDIADNDWEVIYAMMVRQQRMVLETRLCTAALENADWGTNTAAVDGGLLPAGANFTNGTSDEPHIMDALGQAMVRVGLATYGKVQPIDLVVVCNPNTARRMAIAPEIHTYLAQSRFALDSLAGKLGGTVKANTYSLPPVLNHGLEVEVDDAAYEPTHEGELRTPLWVIPDGTIYLVSRKGGIEGAPGTGTFATVVRIYYGPEDQYESEYDNWQRMYHGRTVWDADYQVSSVLTGFRLTNVFGDAA